jgi:hypothetical protein
MELVKKTPEELDAAALELEDQIHEIEAQRSELKTKAVEIHKALDEITTIKALRSKMGTLGEGEIAMLNRINAESIKSEEAVGRVE